MQSAINLLDPSLGIQNVMDMPEQTGLPRARELASNALNEAGLDELYAPSNAWQLMEQALCPDVGDGSLLSPEVFSETNDRSINSHWSVAIPRLDFSTTTMPSLATE